MLCCRAFVDLRLGSRKGGSFSPRLAGAVLWVPALALSLSPRQEHLMVTRERMESGWRGSKGCPEDGDPCGGHLFVGCKRLVITSWRSFFREARGVTFHDCPEGHFHLSPLLLGLGPVRMYKLHSVVLLGRLRAGFSLYETETPLHSSPSATTTKGRGSISLWPPWCCVCGCS